jgi:hypothetical protein
MIVNKFCCPTLPTLATERQRVTDTLPYTDPYTGRVHWHCAQIVRI